MTKLDVLDKHYKNFDVESGWIFDGAIEDVFKAMDEYAKQESIEFAEWIGNSDYVEEDGLYSAEWPGNSGITIAQLYDLFLNEKNRPIESKK